MIQLIAVVLGGMLGAASRYGINLLFHHQAEAGFPAATLFVNIAGSFAIGFLWGLSFHSPMSLLWRNFLFIGFLGSFTTFSSFSLESMGMIQKGEFFLAIAYILSQNVLSLGAAFAGYALALKA